MLVYTTKHVITTLLLLYTNVAAMTSHAIFVQLRPLLRKRGSEILSVGYFNLSVVRQNFDPTKKDFPNNWRYILEFSSQLSFIVSLFHCLLLSFVPNMRSFCLQMQQIR